MTDTRPITDTALDKLDALHAAATKGPWGVLDRNNEDVTIAADLELTSPSSWTARRVIAELPDEPLDTDPDHENWDDLVDREQQLADAQFIAAACNTAPGLVAEVRRLRVALHDDPPPTPDDFDVNLDQIAEAIGDPGSVTPRNDGESVSRLAARAVAMILPVTILGRLHYLDRSNRDYREALDFAMTAYAEIDADRGSWKQEAEHLLRERDTAFEQRTKREQDRDLARRERDHARRERDDAQRDRNEVRGDVKRLIAERDAARARLDSVEAIARAGGGTVRSDILAVLDGETAAP